MDKEKAEVMPSAEEILMNENDLLNGLLEAASFKTDSSSYKTVQVKREGKLLFEFRIRPLEEEEIQSCRKKCTKMVQNPGGRHLPKIEGDVDYVKVRSWKIYTATVEEDRKKIWDNNVIKQRLNVLQGVDVIDACLMAGEKDTICDIIDDISGYGVSREDYIKN